MAFSKALSPRPILLMAIGLIVIGCVATHDLMVPPANRWLPIGGAMFMGPLALLPGAVLFWYILTEDASDATRRALLRGAGLGFVAGPVALVGVRVLSLFGDVWRRWQSARLGGGGESAAWLEPLIYIVFFIPIGLVGAVAGMLVAAAIRRLRAEA